MRVEHVVVVLQGLVKLGLEAELQCIDGLGHVVLLDVLPHIQWVQFGLARADCGSLCMGTGLSELGRAIELGHDEGPNGIGAGWVPLTVTSKLSTACVFNVSIGG